MPNLRNHYKTQIILKDNVLANYDDLNNSNLAVKINFNKYSDRENNIITNMSITKPKMEVSESNSQSNSDPYNQDLSNTEVANNKLSENIKIIENTLSDQDKNYKNSLRKLKI